MKPFSEAKLKSKSCEAKRSQCSGARNAPARVLQRVTVLERLGDGFTGVVSKVQLPDGRHAALKESHANLTNTKAMTGVHREAAMQRRAARAGVAPHVLFHCKSWGQIFSEMVGGAWIAPENVSACAAASDPRRARLCGELSHVLGTFDKIGLSNQDWKLKHLVRGAAGALKTIDFSHVDAGDVALPRNANACSFLRTLRPDAGSTVDHEQWKRWTAGRPVVQCALRCLLQIPELRAAMPETARLPDGRFDPQKALRSVMQSSKPCGFGTFHWGEQRSSGGGKNTGTSAWVRLSIQIGANGWDRVQR